MLIDPLQQKQFLPTEKAVFEEVGTVLDVADGVPLSIGDTVYFDSWLVAKYPKPESTPGNESWYYLVNYESIRAYGKK